MKKLAVILAALAVLSVGMVTNGLAAITVEGEVYVGVFDRYLWRGFDLSDSRPVVQGGVDLSAGNFTLSYWSNWQLNSSDNLSAGNITETDIVLDYTQDLGDWFTASIGNIWYSLKDAPDTNELYVAVTANTLLSPTFTMYWDWDEADDEGLFFTLDISHAFALLDNLELGLGALVSYNLHSDYAVGAYSGFHNYEFSVELNYALTEQLTVSPYFQFSSGLSSAAKSVIDTETLAGVNLSFAF